MAADDAPACDAPAWLLSDDELVAELDGVYVGEQRLAARRLALIREIDGRGVAVRVGAATTAVFVRDRLRVSAGSAARMVKLAAAVNRLPVLQAACRDGAVNSEQAQVIASAVGQLPAEVGAEVTARAEEAMVQFASRFEPHALRKLGDRILSHVAPQIAEQVERRLLERTERLAYLGRTFVLSKPDALGRVRMSGWLDVEAAATVNAALDPLMTPTGGTHLDERSPSQRRADALVQICDLALNTGQLPDNGGDRPQVVVNIDYELLGRQLGAGMLDTGETVTPEASRRLACDAHILPVVLGSAGQVLDVGQSRRLFTGALRRALVARDRGCAFPGCDRPARWTQGHHLQHWSNGGPTSLDNAVLLCRFHHRLVHHSPWQIRIAPDGLPEFIPPEYIDKHQTPQRNTYHRRQ